MPDLNDVRDELKGYTDVLLGRTAPPIDDGVATLYEVANAYYSRAAELTMQIQQAETNGAVLRGTHWYKFRTGELRTFMEMSYRASELGSRRITLYVKQIDMREEV